MTTTARLYASAQTSFVSWCKAAKVQSPPRHEDVARYLGYCMEQRGPNTPMVHMAAIADLFREAGSYLDTKAEPIQAVMTEARRRARAARHSHKVEAAAD